MKNIYVSLDSKDVISGDPYNGTYSIIPISGKINKIKMISLELPIAWYNIRSEWNSFTYSVSGNETTFKIPEGIYTSTTLVSTFNATQSVFTMSYSSVTNKISISNTSSNTSLQILSTNFLTLICGFSENQLFPAVTSGFNNTNITGSQQLNLSIDTFVSIYVRELSTNFQSNLLSTFRIPLTESYGGIQFYQEGSSTIIELSVHEGMSLSSLTFQFLDRFGNVLTPPSNIYWSAVLRFEMSEEY